MSALVMPMATNRTEITFSDLNDALVDGPIDNIGVDRGSGGVCLGGEARGVKRVAAGSSAGGRVASGGNLGCGAGDGDVGANRPKGDARGQWDS